MNLIARIFLKRRQAYRALFAPDNPHSGIVWADLRKFCYGTGTAFHEDSHVHARNEGRREVFERIRSYVNISDDDLYKMVERVEDYND